MQTASLLKDLVFNDNKIAIHVLLDTDFTKEIRIAMKAGQIMKEHKTPFPIVVELFEGCIDFGCQGQVLTLEKGDVLSLEGGVPHDLKAQKDSVVRLSLSKADSVNRVEAVANS